MSTGQLTLSLLLVNILQGNGFIQDLMASNQNANAFVYISFTARLVIIVVGCMCKVGCVNPVHNLKNSIHDELQLLTCRRIQQGKP